MRLLWLSVGDVARSIEIEPALRPDLREMRARLVLPAYLRYPPQEERVEAGALAFLPGTTATFAGETTRALREASWQQEKPVSMKVEGNHFHTAAMLLEKESTLNFVWKDVFGLAGTAPGVVRLMPKEDAPPEVDLRGLEAAIAVLPSEVVPIDLMAADDYGVRRLWIEWQTAARSPQEPPGVMHEIEIAKGQPQLKSLGGHYDFSASLLEIPEDTTVLLRAAATDYFPARAPAVTAIYRIHVLSPEAHARLVHDELEKLQAQLEELTRKQEALLQANKTEKPEAQARQQTETAQQLQALAEKTAAVLKEALRNPQITPKALQEWAQHAEAMHQLASQQMPEAAQSLAAGKMEKAVPQEEKILEQMRAMEKATNDSLEKLMAQTLAARLRKAAASEEEIAGTFQKRVPETIGLTAAQLPEEARHELDTLGRSHDAVTREAEHLHEEIGRLFDRTSLARYQDVAGEMESKKTEDALKETGEWMKENRAIESIESTKLWGGQLRKWADRLEENDASKTAGGGGGKGVDAAAKMQALLALMRLRQAQEQVRDQTSALDTRKGPDYPTEAQGVAAAQGALHDELAGMGQEELAPSAKAMAEAAVLLGKPETGKPTVAAQTDALNLLDAAIAKQAAQAGTSMSALMGMMGMGAGSGTGSMAGGTTSRPNAEVAGTREGAAEETRTVQQAGGVDRAALPAEFREAIESYHRAIAP